MAKKVIRPISKSVTKFISTCGVYEIFHRPTRQRYVGGSSEVEKRLYLHLCLLKIGKHHCSKLQELWTSVEGKGFETYLLDECTSNNLIELEQYHMDKVTDIVLLNTDKVAGSRGGATLNEDSKKRISEAQIKLCESPEERKMRSDRASRQHATGKLGRATWTEDTTQKMKDAPRTKWVFTPEVIEKVKELRLKGAHQRTIAKILGVSQIGVSNVLRKLGMGGRLTR